MDVTSAIQRRRSVRKYKDTKVSLELVRELIESARLAPSGNNTQPWYFIVASNPELISKFCTANHSQKWILSAPLLIVCIADLETRIDDTHDMEIDETSTLPEVKKIIRDTAIAIDHLVLRAEELGLATCWLAWFDQKDLRPIFNIPNDKYVVSVITVGYGDENPQPRPRKNLDDIVFFEKWGNKSSNL